MPSFQINLNRIKAILILFLFNIPFVHAADYKVVIMLGQSNMVGAGKISDINTLIKSFPSGVRENIKIPPYFIWENVDNYKNQAQVWRSLIKHRDTKQQIFQFLPGNGGISEWHGSELGLAYQLKQYQPDTNFAFIKIAVGGTDLSHDWKPSEHSAGGYMFERFKKNFNSAMEQAYQAIQQAYGSVEDDSIEIVGVLWMQGEADAEREGRAMAYENNFTNFISKTREVLQNTGKDYIVNKPDSLEVPFIVGLIMDQQSLDATNCTSPDTPSETRLPYADTVRLSQQTVCDLDEQCSYFETKDYTRACGYNSEIHYDTLGLVQMGFDFAGHLHNFMK